MADHRLNKFLSHNSQSFTLIEMLITVAIIAVLMTVVVLAINPTEITKKARDTQRLTDMANLEMLLQLARSEGMLNTSYCDGTKIYASLPSETPLSNNNLPAGISWAQVSEDKIRNADGTGWIPLNFKSLNYLQTSVLPVDPKNNLDNSLYYTFYCNPEREYILTAYPESQTFGPKGGQDSKTIGDGGPDPYVYEVGNNLFISPLKPVGSWSFDEGGGTTAYDSSGNNNNGTLINGPIWTTGQINQALSFDGYDDYVDCGNVPSLISDRFTAEVWIYPTNMTPIENYGRTIMATSNLYGIWLLVNEGKVKIYAFVNNTGYYYQTTATPVSLNKWNHVVVTAIRNGDGRIYVNGNFIEGFTAYNQTAWLGVFGIGDLRVDRRIAFPGFIDEVRIYNRVLSAEEIKRHYEESK